MRPRTKQYTCKWRCRNTSKKTKTQTVDSLVASPRSSAGRGSLARWTFASRSKGYNTLLGRCRCRKSTDTIEIERILLSDKLTIVVLLLLLYFNMRKQRSAGVLVCLFFCPVLCCTAAWRNHSTAVVKKAESNKRSVSIQKLVRNKLDIIIFPCFFLSSSSSPDSQRINSVSYKLSLLSIEQLVKAVVVCFVCLLSLLLLLEDATNNTQSTNTHTIFFGKSHRYYYYSTVRLFWSVPGHARVCSCPFEPRDRVSWVRGPSK